MKMRATLAPSPRTLIQERHLPQLPVWFPIDQPGEPPMNDDERAAARRARAIEEARRGPFDGAQLEVAWPDGDRPPAVFSPPKTPGYRYVLSARTQRAGTLTYLYDPDSPAHHATMDAVTQAYHEAGAEYARAATTEGTERP